MSQHAKVTIDLIPFNPNQLDRLYSILAEIMDEDVAEHDKITYSRTLLKACDTIQGYKFCLNGELLNRIK